MKQHNLYSGNGYPLNYPHYTIWDNKNNVGLVTDPKNKVKEGDTVFVAIESSVKNENGEEEKVYAYYFKPHSVIKVVEERKAKWQHKVDFKPVFQKLQVKLISE